MTNFSELKAVQSAFWGIRVCVCVLMINSIKKMVKGGVVDWLTGIIFAATFFGMVFVMNNPIVYVVIGAALGLLLCGRVRKGGDKK